MKPGYTVENRIPDPNIHWGIIVYNWEILNVVQNSPIIKNSSSLNDYHIGVWKRKI
jgi:hypothetical protein